MNRPTLVFTVCLSLIGIFILGNVIQRGQSITDAAAKSLPEATGVPARKAPNYWQVDTFNASNLSVSPGNRALWGGQSAAQQPGWATPPGYGNNWNSEIELHLPVPNSAISTTMQITFDYNHETEPGYDHFGVEVQTSGGAVVLASFDGSNRDGLGVFQKATANLFHTFLPSDYVQRPCPPASSQDEIVVRLFVRSDGAWSDEDGSLNTDGAVQVDNIGVTLTAGGQPDVVYFEDFESGTSGLWRMPGQNIGPVCDPDSSQCVTTFGDPVILDGSGSYDTDGMIIAWDWDLGNGDTRSGEVVNYVYPAPGTYTVTLTVTDDRCATSTCTVEVVICPPQKLLGFGRVASSPLVGVPRPSVSMKQADKYYRRDLYMRRFRFRKIREFIGKGEWFAESIVQPLDYLPNRETSLYPETSGSPARDLRRSKRKRKCDYPTDMSGHPDPENPSDCRWKALGGGINWLMYQDYSADGNFCDCLEVHVDWYELDKKGSEIMKAITSNLDFVTPCLKALFPSNSSTGQANTSASQAIAIAGCVVDAASSISSMWGEINDIPFDQPKQMGRFYTELGGLNDLICIPPLPTCTGGTNNYSYRFDYTGTSTKGKIFDPKSRPKQNASAEFQVRLVCNGESQSMGATDCPTWNDCTDPCNLVRYEYGQISGSELHFRSDISCPTLRDPAAFIGTREFVWAIDGDNDPQTGDPSPPLCGADCYVSIKIVSDGTSLSVTRSIYCWEAEECCPTTAGWILQPSLPYNVELTEQTVSATVTSASVRFPLGTMSAWALCRDGSGSLHSALPADPCAERLEIAIAPDTECPTVRKVSTGLVTDGDLSAAVVVQFSEPIQMPAAGDIIFTPAVNVAFALDQTGRILSMTPTSGFMPTYYQCTLTGAIQDLGGNPLRGDLEPPDAACGSPLIFDFCAGNTGVVLSNAGSGATNEFSSGESIFVAGNAVGAVSGVFNTYVVAADVISEVGSALVDQTSTGPTPISISGGYFAMHNLGSIARPGEYALIIDTDLDGIFQLTDIAIQHCTPSLFVGDPCDDSVDGLMSMWGFDEISGSPLVQDLTGLRVGVVSPDAALFPGAGQVFGHLRTSSAGGGGVVTVASDDLLQMDVEDFSCTAWIRPGPGQDQVVLDKFVTNRGYRIGTVGGKLSLTLGDGVGFQTFISSGSLITSAWNHVAIAVDRTDPQGIVMWLNGSYDSAHDPTAQSGSLSNGEDLWIGKGRTQGSPFQVDLDEIALWEEIIDGMDVLALWNAGLQGKACPDTLTASTVGQGEQLPNRQPGIISTYPNPFNPRSTIVFYMRQSQPARLTVFDIMGRAVRILVDGPLKAGRHEVDWNGRDSAGQTVASGVYYVHLRSSEGEATAKVLLLK